MRRDLILGALIGAIFGAWDLETLRAYANYDYITGAPFKILAASIIGAVTGLAGGVCGSLTRRARPLTTNH